MIKPNCKHLTIIVDNSTCIAFKKLGKNIPDRIKIIAVEPKIKYKGRKLKFLSSIL